jgi:hypothetical protein
MELDEETLDGHWSTDSKSGMDFFIINDAIFSKLCILGDDVEPCFEGSSITAPEVSTSFTKIDDNFKKTLYTMMQDLKFALEGGKNMELEEKVTNEEEITEVTEEVAEENETEEVIENEDSIETETTSIEEAPNTEFEAEEAAEEPVEEAEEEGETPSEDKEEEEVAEEENEETAEVEEEEPVEESTEPETVSVEEYSALKAQYAELETKYNELVEYKSGVEREKKENLINSFWMLSEEDKKDVKENIDNYSLDDIEGKLSIICVRKKVNFDSEDSAENKNNTEEENTTVTTFNLNNTEESNVPAWIPAWINTQNSKK